MSANRSVQAAQRRRAGPSNTEPGIPGRSPQPSINSAQMFASQARPGSGPNIPTGRLAGQQASAQQQQMQQQQMQQQTQSQQQSNKLSSVSKMTISQAITLITLRLGIVESKLTNLGNFNDMGFSGESGIDPGFLQSILERLEEVEKQPKTMAIDSSSSQEINLMKQQMDTIKQTIIQTKNSTVALVKENAMLKTQVENMKKELAETRELAMTLQNLTMDNSQKLLKLSMGTECTDESGMIPFTGLQDGVINDDFSNLQDDSSQNEIVGTDLKQLIESELNGNI